MSSTKNKPKVLIIEEEPSLSVFLQQNITAQGSITEILSNPYHFLVSIKDFQPHIILFDMRYSTVNGLQLVRILRQDPILKKLAVIFLIDINKDIELRNQALEEGEEHFVHKPIHIHELFLKINSLSKTITPSSEEYKKEVLTVVKAGTIEINPQKYEFKVNNTPISLTPIEFKLLSLLIERRGRVQTREGLLSTIWDYASEVESRTIDTHIRRLREKLGDQGGLIQTIRGIGYKMIEDN